MQNFCFWQLSIQILWRRRCRRVVDLKLPILQCFDNHEQTICPKPQVAVSPSSAAKPATTRARKGRSEATNRNMDFSHLLAWPNRALGMMEHSSDFGALYRRRLGKVSQHGSTWPKGINMRKKILCRWAAGPANKKQTAQNQCNVSFHLKRENFSWMCFILYEQNAFATLFTGCFACLLNEAIRPGLNVAFYMRRSELPS